MEISKRESSVEIKFHVGTLDRIETKTRGRESPVGSIG